MGETASIAEREIEVRELTVGEIRQWLDDMGNESDGEEIDVVGLMLLEGVQLQDLALMTNLSVADMDAFTPSQLNELCLVCERVNPGLFRVSVPLLGLARRALERYAATRRELSRVEPSIMGLSARVGRFLRLFRTH